MSVLRQDPTTKEWVIIAPQRGRRPHGPVKLPRPRLPKREAGCPFCPGNEEKTPPEILRVEGDGGWRIRVVPNLFAAVESDGSTERAGFGLLREMEGVGAHEVIVESPLHNARMDEMAPEQIAEILRVWRDRYAALEDRPWARAVVLFKNFGAMAGTSLPHPHSQIVAIPVFTPESLHRQSVATRYFDDTGHCVYEDVVHEEVAARDRLITEEGRLLAFAPFASRVPYETWIVPTVHEPSFSRIREGDLRDLAVLLRRTLEALRRAAADPDFNLVVSSPPSGSEDEPACLWTIRILPRLSTFAGFELGSGMSINTVAPEDAAAGLRAAIAKQA